MSEKGTAVSAEGQEQLAVDTDISAQTAQETAESIQAAYDRIANPNQPAKEALTTETPSEQARTGAQPDEMVELRSQVGRIPDLLKRLDDVNGRYGRLAQRFEEMQQRLATPARSQDAATETADDAKELLKDLRDEFPELADKLQSAFSKVIATRGGTSVDPDAIGKMVAERMATERQAATDAAIQELSEAHPDWMQVRETPEFREWKESLPPRARVRFEKSLDPHYVAEMLDQHKEWLTSRTRQPSGTTASQASKSRLSNAVLPTNGTRQAPKGELDAKAIQRAAYEKIAGARR